MKVTITFEVDPEEYDDVENTSPAIVALVQEMLVGNADFPDLENIQVKAE